MSLSPSFLRIRWFLVGLLGNMLFGGCAGEAGPLAPVPQPTTIQAARPNLDSLCRTARTLDSSDQTGSSAESESLRSCLERIHGDWMLDSTALPDLERALDSAVAIYPDAWRASVRDRLRAVARVPMQLEIFLTWPQVAVGSDGGAGVRSRPDGIAVPFQDGGEEIWLASRWESNRLVQVFQASDGLREDAYSLSADGRGLELVATTSGDGMLRPLVITMRFRRP